MSAVSRTVLKALGIFSGVQAMSMLCSVVRTKLIAVWIGPVGVALFAICNTAIDMMAAATRLNIRESAVRDISSAPPSRIPFVAAVVRWWSKRLGLLGAAAISALSPLLSIFSFGDTSRWWVFASLSLSMYVLSVVDGEQAILQGTGRLRKLAHASVRAAVWGTVISAPLYYLWDEASIVPSVIVYGLATFYSFRSASDIGVSRNTRHENIEAGRGFIRLGAYMTISAVITTAASYTFLSYITHTRGEAAGGFFQAGYTIVIRYTGIIFTALSMEFFPRIVKIATRQRMTSVSVSHETLLIVYMLTPLTVLFMALAGFIIEILYTSEFMVALPFVLTGICAMLFRAVSYCMAYVIIARGDGRVYIITEIASSLLGLALNIIMYHFHGFAGLGISYVIWYAAYTMIVGYVYRFRYGMHLTGSALKGCAVSFGLTVASLALRMISWWAVLPMLIPALWFSFMGFRHIFNRKVQQPL